MTLNSSMSAAAHVTPVVTTVNITELRIQKKLPQSYLEIVKYLFKKFLNDQTIPEMDVKN